MIYIQEVKFNRKDKESFFKKTKNWLKEKKKRYFVLLLFVFILGGVVQASYVVFNSLTGGTAISNCQELQQMANNLSGNYYLEGNINCQETVSWNGGTGFAPIGNNNNGFNGVLNGQGFVIENLYINRSEQRYVGLFGRINDGGKVFDLELKNVNITGSMYTGGLAGYTDGVWSQTTNIERVCVIGGSVSGAGSTGGLLGYMAYQSLVEDTCSREVVVEGQHGTGGLVGSKWGGEIRRSYSSSSAGGSGGGKGGLTGQGTSGALNSFWNTDIIVTSSLGEGKTTEELKTQGTFVNWNIVAVSPGTTNRGYTWNIVEGQTFPFLGVGVSSLESKIESSLAGNNSPVVEGDVLQVDVIVRNEGGIEGSYSLELRNLNEVVVDTQQVVVSIEEEKRVTLEWQTEVGDNGEGEVTVVTDNKTHKMNVVILDHEADFAGGEGTTNNPYQITTWNHLHNARNHSTAHFILLNNLNNKTSGHFERASTMANSGEGWSPIRNFSGSFNGNELEISDLFINREGEDGVGLFGSVLAGGEVFRLGVTDVVISGRDGVGSVTGLTAGIIRDSYSSGSVQGRHGVGGLVGGSSGKIEDTYSSASVGGDSYLGGLVAEISATGEISRSFAVGLVSNTGVAGGLVAVANGTVDSSFWDINETRLSTSGAGEGKSTEEMRTLETFSVVGYNIEMVPYGSIDEGFLWNIIDSETYPFFSFTGRIGSTIVFRESNKLQGVEIVVLLGGPGGSEVSSSPLTTSVDGEAVIGLKNENYYFTATKEDHLPQSGLISIENDKLISFALEEIIDYSDGVDCSTVVYNTQGGAKLIENIAQLQCIRENLSAHYVLKRDVDASPAAGWNNGAGFEPIGDNSFGQRFVGIFDGQGFKVRSLSMNQQRAWVGIFGSIGAGAQIKDVGFQDVNIVGINSNWSGTGGLVGYMEGGLIERSYVTGSVEGSDYVGGLVAQQHGGSILNSYTTVTATSHGNRLGGFIANMGGGTVSNSYAAGLLTLSSSPGWSDFGGFVGSARGTVSNCFWDTEVSQKSTDEGGATGRTTAQMMSVVNFQQAGWSIATLGNYQNEIWVINNGTTYPHLYFDVGDLIEPKKKIVFRETSREFGVLVRVFNDSDLLDEIEIEHSLITSSLGTVTVDLKAGGYYFSAEKENLITTTGSFVVGSDDKVVNFTMQKETPPVVMTWYTGRVCREGEILGGTFLWGDVRSLGSTAEADVWFEWGEEMDNLRRKTEPVTVTKTGYFGEVLGCSLKTTGRYYYRAVAENEHGTAEGVVRSFVVGNRMGQITLKIQGEERIINISEGGAIDIYR